MRVAVTFPGCHRRAGVERVAFESARYLASKGHEVTVFAGEWEQDATVPIRYETVPHRASPRFMQPASFFRNSSKQVSGQYDALCTYGSVCPFDGVYWVQSVHRAWLARSSAVRAPWSIKRLKQRVNPIHPVLLKLEQAHLGKRRYRKLIALTENVKNDLMHWYDVPAQDVVVIPNGYSEIEFNVQDRSLHRARTRRELGFSKEDRVIIFVANELERKGFGPLLRAIHSLNDPSLKLLAVGRLANTYAAEIASLGMTGRVVFTGPTSNAAHYYAASDIFALPTQYEAWGLVIVEAMACGLPVLTSRLAGAAIAVHAGKSGLLLDNPCNVHEIAGYLKTLLEGNHDAPEQISSSVRDYSWNHILRQYEQVLIETAS